MYNDNNLGIKLIMNFFNKLDPVVKELNERHNRLEEKIKSEVVRFNDTQVEKLTRISMIDREDYFDIEINKLNFKIRKAEQKYHHNHLKLLKALKEELEFFSKHHTCIAYKKKRTKATYFVFNNVQLFDVKLELLYKGLVNGGYIDCTSGVFKAIFKENVIKLKVDWKKAFSSLNYFINQLLEIEGFSAKDKWIVAVKCFTHEFEEIDKVNLAKATKVSSDNLMKINSILKSV
jgi:isochorismate synthase EntC